MDQGKPPAPHILLKIKTKTMSFDKKKREIGCYDNEYLLGNLDHIASRLDKSFDSSKKRIFTQRKHT